MAKRAPKTKPAPRRRTLRQPPIPGTEGVRDLVLDRLCESATENRQSGSDVLAERKGIKAAALKRMTEKQISVYKHGGTEFVRVPGADDLRMRPSKDGGDAGVGPSDADEADYRVQGEENEDGSFTEELEG